MTGLCHRASPHRALLRCVVSSVALPAIPVACLLLFCLSTGRLSPACGSDAAAVEHAAGGTTSEDQAEADAAAESRGRMPTAIERTAGLESGEEAIRTQLGGSIDAELRIR
jgi:hypothetical protein